LDLRGNKLKNWDFGENFPDSEMCELNQPEHHKIDLTQVKNFDPDTHYFIHFLDPISEESRVRVYFFTGLG